MKKVFAILFVGSMVAFAACDSKPKTEETSATAADSSAMVTSDSTAMTTDSAAVSADTTAAADSTK
ncbi:hypothetical protein [Tellurirhabdus rosea]|uniref:hypothetical protein n=1 Tax=Tellurirhabdus rosea TaxID=2674997 RepID=UPI00225727C1|nr:hypothetical protein [Tellurirhabdus rosea]